MKKIGGFIIETYRDLFTSDYDVYDSQGTNYSMKDKCVFCSIASDSMPGQRALWYQDEYCAVFEDIKPYSTLHALVIPKRHIRDINHLKKSDSDLLKHMELVAITILDQRGFKEYRLGFHQPPFNSMFHLHMHIAGLPLLPERASSKKLN